MRSPIVLLCASGSLKLRCSRWLALVGFFITVVGLASAQLNVPLTIQEALYPSAPTRGIDRQQGWVRVGIPLPQGSGITSDQQLGLSGASAGQFRVTGRWPSGEVKWVTIDTLADVTAGLVNTGVTLTTGSGNFGGSNLAHDNGATISVDTGAAQFTIVKTHFDLFDKVVAGGKTLIAPGTSRGLVVSGPAAPGTTCGTCTTEYTSSNDAMSNAVLEENGPVVSVIKATWQHKDAGGNGYLRGTARMYFVRGQSGVKVRLYLQNADEGPSNSFASAYKGFAAYDARLTIAGGNSKKFLFGTDASPVGGTFSGNEAAEIYQAYSSSMERNANYCQYVSHPEIVSYITRSVVGRPNGCNTAYQYAQSGFQITQGQSLLGSGDSGTIPQGWADFSDQTGAGLEVGVYEMAANWPKGLEAVNGGNEVRVEMWPDQSHYRGGGGIPYYLDWPQRRITDLYFNFHGSGLASPANEFLKFQHPLLASADFSWYNRTGAFYHKFLDPAKEDEFYRANGIGCCLTDTNPVNVRWFQWGDGGGGNQAEQRFAYLTWFMQRKFPGYYVWAMNHFRYMQEEWAPWADMDANGAQFHWRTHTPTDDLNATGWPNNITSLNRTKFSRNWGDTEQHAHWWGLIYAYYLTGDDGIKDFIYSGVADRFTTRWGFNLYGGLFNTRGVGAEIETEALMHDFYASNGDQTNADLSWWIADNVMTLKSYPALKVSGYGDLESGGTSYTRGFQHGPGDLNNDSCYPGGPNVYRQQKPFMNAIYAQGVWTLAQSHGPGWSKYGQTMDMVTASGLSSITEQFLWGPTRTAADSGMAYCMDIDNPNPLVRPAYSQTTWFDFFAAQQFLHDSSQWKQKYIIQQQRACGNPSCPEFGLFATWDAIDVLINSDDTSVADVQVQATNLGGGSWRLNYTLPGGVTSARAKYFAGKTVVSWLGFDAVNNAFIGNPATTAPWFAATELHGLPQAPGPQQFTVTGLDPGKSYNFAIKAFVGGGGGGGGDNQPPTVTITAPARDAVVSGTINLSATATDNVAVSWVQFQIDGNPVGAHITHPPYTVSWNTTTVPNGSHTITALASDPSGNLGSASEPVTVNNQGNNNPPVVTITSPLGNSTVIGTITLAANATSQNGIAWVSFKVDGTNVGTQITNPPYAMQWNSATVPDGSHTITATASDHQGQQASASIRVQTRNNGQNPSLTITTPHTGDSVSGQVNVSAQVNNLNHFGLVFRVDHQTIGVLSNLNGNSVYSVPWDTTRFSNGSHTVNVSAVLSTGAASTPLTSSVSVTVNNGGNQNPPHVVITSPISNNVSNTVLVAADATSMYGIAKVQFFLDNHLMQTVTVPPYQMSWDTKRNQNGVHALLAVATDTRGTVGQASKNENVQNSDNIPPSVTMTSPQNNAHVSGSIQLAADASDNNGVFAVEFMVDGNYVGGQITTPPYSVNWDSHSVSNGSHRIAARAWDLGGNQADSSPVVVTVSNNGGQQGWTKQQPTWDSHFGYRSWHQLVYDPIQRKVLAWMAVSGCDDPWSNALWAYDTATTRFYRKSWSGAGELVNGNCVEPKYMPNPPNHPGDRHPYHQMTYDSNRGRMWIYSGVADGGKCDNTGPGICDYRDMWYYDSTNSSWTCTDTGGGCNSETTNMYTPDNRQEGAMVYDPVNDVIVFFGGLTHGNQTNDTWHYSPSTNTWTRVYDNNAPGLPPERNGDSLVYDASSRKIVMFGGMVGHNPVNDLWLYDAATKVWTNPQPPVSPAAAKFPALAYDSTRNQVVYYAGPDNTWAYSVANNRWTNLNISGGPSITMPAQFSMTYDPGSDTFVVVNAAGPGEVWHLKIH